MPLDPSTLRDQENVASWLPRRRRRPPPPPCTHSVPREVSLSNTPAGSDETLLPPRFLRARATY